MRIESAAAAIDFAGLIDEAVRNKNGREEFDAASAQLNGIHEYEAVVRRHCHFWIVQGVNT